MQAELLEQLEKKKARAARFNLPVKTTGEEVWGLSDSAQLQMLHPFWHFASWHSNQRMHCMVLQEQLRLKKRAERFKGEAGAAPKTGDAAEFEAKKKVQF